MKIKNKNWKKIAKDYKKQCEELQKENNNIENLKREKRALQAVLSNLRLDYYYALTKTGHKCDKPQIENVQVSPEQISDLIQKGLLYRKLNDDYCELYSKYRSLISKTNLTLNSIKDLEKLTITTQESQKRNT